MKLVITSNDIGSSKDKKDDLFSYVLRLLRIIYGQLLKMNLSLFQYTLLFTKYLIYKIPRKVTCIRENGKRYIIGQCTANQKIS